MGEYTTAQLAVLTEKSERTIQLWIQKGTLAASHIEGNRYEVDEDALQPFLPHAVVEGLSSRLDALESRVESLEAIIREMVDNPPVRRVTPPRPVHEKGMSRTTQWRRAKQQREGQE